MNIHQTINWDRLRHFIKLFEQVPNERVDLRVIAEKHACGTRACFIGWMALQPDGQALGLYPVFNQAGNASLELNSGEISFRGAAKVLFGLTYNQAQDLFGVHQGQYDPAEYDPESGPDGDEFPIGDKELLLYRLRQFFTEHKEVL